MTSTLQEQLQRIAAAAGITPSKSVRGKPSLLFTFQEAADKGIQDIYEIALPGKLILRCLRHTFPCSLYFQIS